MDIVKFFEINTGFVKQEIEKGKIFVIPTDTSYGIAGRIEKETIQRAHRIKKRLQDKFWPIFVNKKIIKEIADVSKEAEVLMNKFWPGDLTLVLKVKKDKASLLRPVLGPNNTIAAREPNSELILNILEDYKLPITATSANISNKPPAYDSKQVMDYFTKSSSSPDYFIDAGSLPKKPVSTIIDTTKGIKILRTGRIKLKDIKELL